MKIYNYIKKKKTAYRGEPLDFLALQPSVWRGHLRERVEIRVDDSTEAQR